MIRVLILFLMFARAGWAGAQVEATLDAVAALDKAALGLAAAHEGEEQVAALTSVVKAYETGLAVLRDAERRAKIAHGQAEERFNADSEEVSRLLAAMQAAGAPTTATGLLHPSGPLGSARAAMLMGEVVPGLQGYAALAGEQLHEILALEGALSRARAALEHGAEGARQARLSLVSALRDRGDIPDARDLAGEGVATAGRTLEELALTLSETGAGEVIASDGGFRDMLGGFPLPVQGAVLGRFGDRAERPGVTLAVRENALVSAPFSASVRFSGAVGGYGNVIILEPAPGYLLVLTGVHEPLVGAGQDLPPGAALGLMGAASAQTTGLQDEHGQLLSETLYVETRANGDTVDPATWFALDEER